MLLQRTPWLPDKNDVKIGVITYKISAHAADQRKEIKELTIETSTLRFEFR